MSSLKSPALYGASSTLRLSWRISSIQNVVSSWRFVSKRGSPARSIAGPLIILNLCTYFIFTNDCCHGCFAKSWCWAMAKRTWWSTGRAFFASITSLRLVFSLSCPIIFKIFLGWLVPFTSSVRIVVLIRTDLLSVCHLAPPLVRTSTRLGQRPRTLQLAPDTQAPLRRHAHHHLRYSVHSRMMFAPSLPNSTLSLGLLLVQPTFLPNTALAACKCCVAPRYQLITRHYRRHLLKIIKTIFGPASHSRALQSFQIIVLGRGLPTKIQSWLCSRICRIIRTLPAFPRSVRQASSLDFHKPRQRQQRLEQTMVINALQQRYQLVS